MAITATKYPSSADPDRILSVRMTRARQTTIERGVTLWLSGYDICPTINQGIYCVLRPISKVRPGEPVCYFVDAFTGTCNCPICLEVGTCKHKEAVQHLVFSGDAPGMTPEQIEEFHLFAGQDNTPYEWYDGDHMIDSPLRDDDDEEIKEDYDGFY